MELSCSSKSAAPVFSDHGSDEGAEEEVVIPEPHMCAPPFVKDGHPSYTGNTVHPEINEGPGLIHKGAVKYSQPGPHLNEIIVQGDMLFVSNSFDSFATFRVEEGTGLTEVLAKPSFKPAPRCTTIALHEASNSLYCAAADGLGPLALAVGTGNIARIDLSDAVNPSLVKAHELSGESLLSLQLAIHEEQLFMAAFEKGLWVADIQEDGSLSDLRDTGLGKDVRSVASFGEDLLLLDHEAGLLKAIKGDDGWGISAKIVLGGPSLGLRVVGDKALVSLGSKGLLVAGSSGDGLEELYRLNPPGVVVSADRKGDAVVAATLSGLYLYDLRDGGTRVAGFAPSTWVMLDAAFVGEDVVVSDWRGLVRYGVDLNGHVLTPDIPRDRYFAPGEDIRITLRNPGDLDLHLSLLLFGGTGGSISEVVHSLELKAGEEQEVSLEASLVDLYLEPLFRETALYVFVNPHKDGDPCLIGGNDVLLVERWEETGANTAHPGQGQEMAMFAVSNESNQLRWIPKHAKEQRVVFYASDCSAMWPELEDLAWLHRNDEMPYGGLPLFVSPENPFQSGYVERWSYEDLNIGYFGDVYNPVSLEIQEANAEYGDHVYDDGFSLDELRGGAEHPTDYVVDEKGVVRSVERLYRGLWGL